MYLRIMMLCAAVCMASAACFADDNDGIATVEGLPLSIDGSQSSTPPSSLSPALLDQVRNVATLGDALRILGPGYISPNDKLHIAHWHFQNGFMLTLWPQGGEALNDAVNVYPRPDCGMPADTCTDLVLGRKSAQKKKHGGGGGSGGGSGSALAPLMHIFSGR